MMFQFNAHSALLLPFVVPGTVLSLFLLIRGLRTGARPDVLLALLVAWPTLAVAQWMLGYANWYDSHDWHSTIMFYVPWQVHLLLGPLWFLYFRALTNQEFRLRHGGWRHLLPGLGQIALFAGVALLDLGYRQGWRGEVLPDFYGTKGAAATWRDTLFDPLAYAGHALLLGYGLATLRAYRRYRRYLDDNFSETERLRFAGLRHLLILLLSSLVLSLLYSLLEELTGGLSYDTAWYAFAVRGGLIYALAVAGLQANQAAATSPLRFEVGAVPDVVIEASEATSGMPEATSGASKAITGASLAIPAAAEGRQGEAATLPAELAPLRDQLLRLMAVEQPYLEPELTLTELAQRLHSNTSILSKVINTGCGQNFNDFVNTYRVAEARRKLADPRFAHYSLVGVALESGFNSKSTFNRVFKKLAGQAPSEVVRPK
jgi:AraC-like DNA-binding protein